MPHRSYAANIGFYLVDFSVRFAQKNLLMEYLTTPIAALIKWTFDTILIPLGELPAIANPNNIFIVIMAVGLGYWLYVQGKYNRKAQKEGGLK
jgi:hypothetical protein